MNNGNGNLVGYMRVSTDGGKQSTALQEEALLSCGVSPENIYKDFSSGVRYERDGLIQVLESLKEGETLVVWKLDRLGRSLSHLIQLIDGLHRKGMHFKSLTEDMDTSTSSGMFYFQMFGALAEYERSLIR